MKSFLMMILGLTFASTVYADGSFTYRCSNLNPMGTFVIEPTGQVHFYFPEDDSAEAMTQADVKALVPPGKGGQLYYLRAWAAGTVIRVPEIAATGPASFKLPWANGSFQGYGQFRGTGTCKRTQ